MSKTETHPDVVEQHIVDEPWPLQLHTAGGGTNSVMMAV